MVWVVIALAAVGWYLLFALSTDGLWPRTWLVAAVLTTVSAVALARSVGLAAALGPDRPRQVLLGVAVGVGWLIATHVGHDLLGRLFPTFLRQVTDLYRLRSGDRVATMVGPVVLMGVAEEVTFRGVIQARLGLAGAAAIYVVVQLVARNAALLVAAGACGLVWGVLAWWAGGLLAPILAHVIWTTALTFVWPLGVTHDRAGDAGARVGAGS